MTSIRSVLILQIIRPLIIVNNFTGELSVNFWQKWLSLVVQPGSQRVSVSEFRVRGKLESVVCCCLYF